jgi:hypothetical protein
MSMRSIISILPRLVVAGMLVFASVAVAFGQDRIEVRREWSNLANGRTEFEVSDPVLLPRRLALAAEHSGCRYKEGIEQHPVSFIKLGSRRLAIVYCYAIVGSHQVFDLSNLERPRPVEFPFLAQPEGFGTTVRPGGITWKKEDGIFQAVIGSDMLPTIRVRHTYRFDENQVSPTFVIVRVEGQQVPGPDEWTTIWDAQRWSLPALRK